jgi:putative transposase
MSDPEVMRRVYVYKLRPTPQQEAALSRTLDACRDLYNAALEHRREVYRATGRGVTRYDQHGELKDIRRLDGWEDLRDAPVHTLQDALGRLDRAYRNFFRRHAAGKRGGFPRFQPAARYRSITFPEWGNDVSLDGCRLRLAKIGRVKLQLHRPVEGKPKFATIVRKADGWHAHILCEVSAPGSLRSDRPAVGIDVGVAAFATLSTGEQVANPRHADSHRRDVDRARRVVSRRQRGSNRRRKAIERLAKAKQREVRARRDFHHKLSRLLVEKFGTLVVEDLSVARMVLSGSGKRGLNRSIADAGWSQFVAMLDYKASSAGGQLVKVDARRTSQTCAVCGIVDPLSRRSQAVFRCTGCGHEANADHNAALNILNRARARPVVEAAHVAA